MVQGELNFSGAVYVAEFDYSRLKGQMKRMVLTYLTHTKENTDA